MLHLKYITKFAIEVSDDSSSSILRSSNLDASIFSLETFTVVVPSSVVLRTSHASLAHSQVEMNLNWCMSTTIKISFRTFELLLAYFVFIGTPLSFRFECFNSFAGLAPILLPQIFHAFSSMDFMKVLMRAFQYE